MKKEPVGEIEAEEPRRKEPEILDAEDEKIVNPSPKWVRDLVGNQGWVLLDSNHYWLTRWDKESGAVYFSRLSTEEFKKRNEDLARRIKDRKSK